MPKAIKGQTDLWTTSPQVAAMLLNPDDGYHITSGSHQKRDFKCPHCNTTISSKMVRKVVKEGLKCHVCSDGISYPEKFVANLLVQLCVEFSHDTTFDWSGNKRYDFYIQNKNLIIETHGIQHYSDKKMFGNANRRLEKPNDEYKRNLAIDNDISKYIELDCRYSEFDYIRQSVLNSDIRFIYDLSCVDWDLLERSCLESKVVEACNMYNKGIKNTNEISRAIGINRTTVREYLRRCADAGLCDYTGDRHKKIICVDTGEVYPSLASVKGAGFNMSQVSECCNGKAHTAGGYNWCFYDEYNPDTYIMRVPKIDNTSKTIMCIETGKIYNGLASVKDDGFTPSAVSRVCNGCLSKHKNHHFKFI